MKKHDYTQAMSQPYPIFFMANTLFLFFLFHYSIWQREDQSRSPIPFSDIQFFHDFFTQTFDYLDPFITSLILLVSLCILCINFIASKRVLHISDEQISWSILGYHYTTVVKCRDIQQIQYIEIPPQDKNQTVLLRFKTPHSECDLKLNLFNEVTIQAILEQLSKYQASLQSDRISISKTI